MAKPVENVLQNYHYDASAAYAGHTAAAQPPAPTYSNRLDREQ